VKPRVLGACVVLLVVAVLLANGCEKPGPTETVKVPPPEPTEPKKDPVGPPPTNVIKPADEPVAVPAEVAILRPEESGSARLTKKGTLYFLEVSGSSSGVHGEGRTILLYLDPHEGPSGWYLQLPGHTGMTRLDSDGSWLGQVQIGNHQYPPEAGDPPVEVAAVVLDEADADEAVGEKEDSPDSPVPLLPEGEAQTVVKGVKLVMPSAAD